MEGTINDDAGAMIRDGVKTLVKLGVCRERKWPYKIAKFTNKPPAACYKEASEQQMRQCLAEGYPFVFGFSVYEAFEADEVARTGKLNLPEPSEKQLGGHAVMAVGYDDSAERVLVRNSWGADWGIKGYFTMPY